MGLAVKSIVLCAVVLAATVWMADLDLQRASVLLMVGAVAAAIVFAWALARRLSRRRRLSQMRDSALW